jgi:hypothetical protein
VIAQVREGQTQLQFGKVVRRAFRAPLR